MLLGQYLIKLWKKRSWVVFAGCSEKTFPNPKLLTEFLPVFFLPCMFVFCEKEVQLLAQSHYTNTMPQVEPSFRLASCAIDRWAIDLPRSCMNEFYLTPTLLIHISGGSKVPQENKTSTELQLSTNFSTHRKILLNITMVWKPFSLC